MQQQLFKPMPRKWDAIRHEPFDDEHQRALEGLPHYWKLSWGWEDVIIFSCGHARRVAVERLTDPKFNPNCPYKEFGGCDGSEQHSLRPQNDDPQR